MKPIQKLATTWEPTKDFIIFKINKIIDQQNEIIDRLNSLTGEEKEPCDCLDARVEPCVGKAREEHILLTKARFEGQIEGLEMAEDILLHDEFTSYRGKANSAVNQKIIDLKDQLTNLK